MKSGALAVWLCLGAASAAASDLSVSATLNNQRAALGNQLMLSVAISGSSSAAPRAPLIADVEVYESGKSQNMSIINGSISSQVVYTYVLQPRKAGRFIVPPIEVPGAAPTAPIEFVVETESERTPSSPPQTTRDSALASDAFVTATLTKLRPFVNEQVTLTVRFFTAVSLLDAPRYAAPTLTGLLSEDLGAQGQGTTVIGGRSYNFSELKSALFPVSVGRATIGPAVVTVRIPRRGSQITGDDFFDRFFNMNMSAPESRRLQSDPLSIQADPLPDGAPEDFSGIVGVLTIAATADRTRLKAGEALNMTVTVTGIGNIKSLPEPKRPRLPSVRFFDSESSIKIERFGDKVGGSKIFKMVLVPRVSGPLEIPPLTISYFDSAKRAYARAQSLPIRINVLPGDPNAALPVASPNASPAPDVMAMAVDIHYLKAPGGHGVAVRKLGTALAAFGAPKSWHAIPFLFVLAALLIDWRRRALASNPRARRTRKARATAERRLRESEAQTDIERAVALLGEALTGYFADKFDQPVASLTLKAVIQRLENQPSPPDLAKIDRLKSAWNELDLLRYAPGGAGQAEIKRLSTELQEITRAFDKELRP